MNFTEITKALKEVSEISSTNERVEFLKNHNDPDFKEVLSWYLDNSRITGIAEKKFDKVGAASPEMDTQDQKTFSDVIRYLDCNRTGRDEDVAWIKYLGMNICKDIEEMNTFRSLVCKNYPMGLREGLVNKAFPNLVPVYEVMLADKYYDLDEKKRAKVFGITETEETFLVLELEDGSIKEVPVDTDFEVEA